MREYLQLLQPMRWLKNLFVALPLLFVGIYSQDALFAVFFTFVLFSIASASVYIVDDLFTRQQDKKHPTRCHRPLVSGAISKKAALGWVLLCYVLLLVGFFFKPLVVLVVLAYIILNFAYHLLLKQLPIVDIFSIAVSLLLRVYAGTIALQMSMSPWLLIMMLSLALFVAAIQRKQEILRAYNSGMLQSEKMTIYNEFVLRGFAEMAAGTTIVLYSVYILISNQIMIISIPLLIFAIFRYWYVVGMQDKSDSATDALYTDIPLLIVIAIWVAITLYLSF